MEQTQKLKEEDRKLTEYCNKEDAKYVLKESKKKLHKIMHEKAVLRESESLINARNERKEE